MSEQTEQLLGEIRAGLRCSVCPEDIIPIERTREQMLVLHDELLDFLLRPTSAHVAEVRRRLERAHAEDLVRAGHPMWWGHGLRWRLHFS